MMGSFADSAAFLLDSIATKLRASRNPLLQYPTPSYPSPYPDTYTDSYYLTWYKRIPAAHFIVEDMALDVWEKGFHIKELPDEEAVKTYNAFNKLFIPQLPQALALSRLYGRSLLLLGFNDTDTKNWTEPVDWKSAKLKWTAPIPKTGFSALSWVDIPETPENVNISTYPDLPQNIHRDRFIYLEHTNIADPTTHGVSVLEVPGDTLSTQRDLLWSIGQRIWRAAVGLLTLKGPKGIKSDVRDKVLQNWMDVNAKFVGYLPQDWSLQVDGLGAKTASVDNDWEVFIGQLATAARVPVSVLMGSPKGAVGSKDRDMSDYMQTISTIQASHGQPLAREGLTILTKTGQLTLPDEYTLKFNPLYQRSAMEEALDIAGVVLADYLRGAVLDDQPDLPAILEAVKPFFAQGTLLKQ